MFGFVPSSVTGYISDWLDPPNQTMKMFLEHFYEPLHIKSYFVDQEHVGHSCTTSSFCSFVGLLLVFSVYFPSFTVQEMFGHSFAVTVGSSAALQPRCTR